MKNKPSNKPLKKNNRRRAGAVVSFRIDDNQAK